MTILEIEARKKELAEKINEAKTTEELEELRKAVEEINSEVPQTPPDEAPEEPAPDEPTPDEEATEEEATEETAEETPAEEVPQAPKCSCEDERKLIRVGTEDIVPIGNNKEERKMTNSKYSAETRAWAKKLMGYSPEQFDEEEKRALGDAVTTTATTFVEADADHNGVNNGGFFIPKEVRMEFMQQVEQMSPFFRDIRKLAVNGNIDLPYLYEGDDANWYAELNCTANEGQEYRNLQLTGWELAKDIVITWKAEQMTVEAFVRFLVDELVSRMGKALIKAVIYGNGSNKPTGAIYNLSPVTDGDTPIDNIINGYASLSEEARVGAKAYVSTSVRIAMIGYKDQNGNYPFLQGLAGSDLFTIETDPFLENNDCIVGNAKWYILNEVSPIRVDWERTVKCRQTRIGGYAIYDGKPRPNFFALAQYTPAASV